MAAVVVLASLPSLVFFLQRSKRDYAVHATDAGSDSSDRICTLIGCAPAFQVDFKLALPFSRLRGSLVDICYNGSCTQGFMNPVNPEPAGSNVRDFEFLRSKQADRIRAGVRASGEHDFALGVEWRPGEHRRLAVGDEFRVVLRDRDGVDLYERRWRVYSVGELIPNGPDCPPTCQVVAYVPVGD